MEVDEAQVQAVHCFAASFRHPATNELRNGILRVNSQNQSVELFTIEGLILSIGASNIICFQFDVRNPETQLTIYRRAQLPVNIQTANSDDSDQICVLLDALIASRPIAPNCKFLRSGQADLNGKPVTLILLGNAHIVFAQGPMPILLINLAHTKISLTRKTGVTLTLLKGAEQEYLLEMKTERERQEWVVAFNRAMAIRKTPTGRSSVLLNRKAASITSPSMLNQSQTSSVNNSQADQSNRTDEKETGQMQRRSLLAATKTDSFNKREEKVETIQNQYASMTPSSNLQKRGSFSKYDQKSELSPVQRPQSLYPASKRNSFDNNDDKLGASHQQRPSLLVSPGLKKQGSFEKDGPNAHRHSAVISVPTLQKRDSLSKRVEIEPEPEPLRPPSFVAPVSVQMKSIRSSYAVARSLVSATSIKRSSSAGSESPSNRKRPDEYPDTDKKDDDSSTKSAAFFEKVAKPEEIASVGKSTGSQINAVTACLVMSIEKDGMLRQLTSSANIIHLAARCAEAAAITTDGSILQWSFSEEGIATGPVTIPHPDAVDFAKLSCGRDHHLAVSSDPSLQLYGWGRCSLLGMKGTIKTVTSTTLIPALAHVKIRSVTSAAKHTFVVTTDDEIWSWGGEGPWLGRDQTRHHFTPTQITTRLPAIVQMVACSTESSYVLTTSGQVFACGTGRYGRLGLGDCQDRNELTLVPIPEEIVDVIPGGRHVVTITKSNHVYAWGCNANGQLGIQAAVKMSMSPVLVPTLTNSGVVRIACAKTATMALTQNAEVLLVGSLTGKQILDSPTILELDPSTCGRVQDIVCGYNIALIMAQPPAAS